MSTRSVFLATFVPVRTSTPSVVNTFNVPYSGSCIVIYAAEGWHKRYDAYEKMLEAFVQYYNCEQPAYALNYKRIFDK